MDLLIKEFYQKSNSANIPLKPSIDIEKSNKLS